MKLTNFSLCRNFLLFLPAESPNLRTVLSYYSATGNLNPEGDVSINQLEGLGTDLFLLLHRFLHAVRSFLRSVFQLPVLSANIAPRPGLVSAGEASKPESLSGADLLYFDGDIEVEMLALPRSVVMWLLYRSYKQKLTENTPNLGYFFAGGLAGAISRTATAPLDRLKVYLIAQTGVKEEALKAAKEGSPLHAVSRGFRSLIDATKELWRAGGVRSLFAGECIPSNPLLLMVIDEAIYRKRLERREDHARIRHQIWCLRSMSCFHLD